ncbi:hypothetical protein CEXT_802391 [Caerostris extrusa]|uniref:Uncharacterized protein n=1 Tax=Caerostris extrusa TaxID=172846 RepID=A0AAV4Y735_CAEEX|nr:hypothetical protein CEXT_802391 [Caerostris extrusa]
MCRQMCQKNFPRGYVSAVSYCKEGNEDSGRYYCHNQNSDLQSDYDQMNANLMQKRQLLAEWVSRVPCPLANCNIHHSNVKNLKDLLTN